MSEDTENEATDASQDEELVVARYNQLGEWQVARDYCKAVGSFSELFLGCSRTLIHCYEQENGKLSKIASSQLQRLFGSPSMLSQLFFAAKTYYPNEITSRQSIEPADLIFFVNLYQLSLMITIGYSTRRLSKTIPADSWKPIIEPLQIYCDLAVPLGDTIPVIGPSRALMTAAGKFLGWSLFCLIKPEEFKKYRIDNKMHSRGFDLDTEVKTFGTTHLHIAALFWQRFGFGVRTCEEYIEGLLSPDMQKLSPAAMKFRVAQIWLESLIEKKSPPLQDLGEDYDIEEKKIDELVSKLIQLQDNGSSFSWLSKQRGDISPELTPDLTADYAALLKATELKRPRR